MATKKSKPAAKPKASSPPLKRGSPKNGRTNFVLSFNRTVALMVVPTGTAARFSLETAATLTGVHPELLRYYCRLGVIKGHDDGRDGNPTFDANTLREVRQFDHYRRNLAVSRRALPLLCALRRESERLQIALHFLSAPSANPNRL